jgi:hypothetical protein
VGALEELPRIWSHYQTALSVKARLLSKSTRCGEHASILSLFHYLISALMLSVAWFIAISTRPVMSSSSSCPTTTIRPDANGWVPPGTCGYISRPYYPSFVAALVFSAAVAAGLAGYASKVVRTVRYRRRLADQSISSWRDILLLPVFAILISTCLLIAYILRAFGTRHQQVPEFVAYSDTLVLICPLRQYPLSSIRMP